MFCVLVIYICELVYRLFWFISEVWHLAGADSVPTKTSLLRMDRDVLIIHSIASHLSHKAVGPQMP